MPYFILLFSFFIVSIVLYYFSPDYLSNNYIFIIIIGVFLASFSFIVRKESDSGVKGQYFRHSFIFLFSFLIVHFQYPIDLLIGNSNVNDYFIWINESVIVKSLALSAIGLVAFMIGYFVRGKSFKGIAKPSIVSTASFPYAALIAFVFYFAYAGKSYLSGNYGLVKLNPAADYIVMVFNLIVFSYLIQHSRNLRAKGVRFKYFFDFFKSSSLIINIVIVIYLFSVMLSGDRGPVIYWTIAYFSCYLFVADKKLSAGRVFIYLIFGVFFIATLGHVRSLDRSVDFTQRFASSIHLDGRFDTPSISPKTQELARSIRTVHMAVDYVPERHDFMFGRFQYQQLASIIPFGYNIATFLFSDNSYKYSGSSRFLTWVEQGDSRYSGVGSSVVADFYLDFGAFGVIVGMFIVGLTIRHSELAMYSGKFPGYFSNALFVYFLSKAIYIPRSTFLVELKFVVLIYVILRVNSYFSKKFS